jgi:membrane-bound serine protease (ClpP class)
MSRLVGLLMAVCLGAAAQAAGPSVRVVHFDTDINGASSKRILDAIDAAGREHDALILIELDTPGARGRHRDRDQEDPRVAGAGRRLGRPAGARAASGGFYLLIAADVAAMAPGTRTGAASVVFGMGKSEEGTFSSRRRRAIWPPEPIDRGASRAQRRGLREGRRLGRVVHRRRGVGVRADRSHREGPRRAAGPLDGRKVKRFDGSAVTLALADPEIVEPHRTRAERAEERSAGSSRIRRSSISSS